MKDVTIRSLSSEDLQEALTLAWEVFSVSQARDCTQEGIDEFYSSIDFEFMLYKLGEGHFRFWGAFVDEIMVAMLCFAGLRHVQLLYVAPQVQGKGIAGRLLKRAVFDSKLNEDELGTVTANVPPCAYSFFEEQGFEAQGEEISEFGSRYRLYALSGGRA